MKRVLRRQKSGYALSFILWFFGLAALFWTLWKTWPDVSAANNPLSVFWDSLWNQTLDFIPDVEFKLVYLLVFASAMLVAGSIVFSLSRKWFLLEGKNSLLQCPWCRKRWRTSPDKALVLCPYCRQLVHPILVDE
jgi:hypothetical protein